MVLGFDTGHAVTLTKKNPARPSAGVLERCLNGSGTPALKLCGATAVSISSSPRWVT